MKLYGMKRQRHCWEEFKCCVCLHKVEYVSQGKWMDLTVCIVSTYVIITILREEKENYVKI